MTMSDLAARLALAADDLATMRAELAAESDFEVFGGGAAAELAAQLTLAWRSQHERLDRLSRSLGELAADVRLAARRYDAADSEAAGTFTASVAAHGEAGAKWTR
jgi:Excreted virulence factor EspC, type VII ESX diderm